MDGGLTPLKSNCGFHFCFRRPHLSSSVSFSSFFCPLIFSRCRSGGSRRHGRAHVGAGAARPPCFRPPGCCAWPPARSTAAPGHPPARPPRREPWTSSRRARTGARAGAGHAMGRRAHAARGSHCHHARKSPLQRKEQASHKTGGNAAR